MYDNQGATVFSVAFVNSDILNIQPDKADATTEEIKQVKVDLYVETMTFEYSA